MQQVAHSTEKMLIGGAWVEAASGKWINVVTPTDRNRVIATTPRANKEDADRVVTAARKAFDPWSSLHFKERQTPLLKIADALEDEAENLSELTALDVGNAIRTQARPESQTLVELFRYFGGVAGEVKGNVLPAGEEQLQYSRREPLGVVAGILPWNSPLLIAGFKTPAALVAGNSVVLKAAEDAPLTILRFAEICQQFLPPGVLNVVTGYGNEIGEALVDHPSVDKVSFTGSTQVGRRIAERTGARLAHSSLELGGKSPIIVFPDAATEETVDEVIAATRLARQGQSCTSGSRLFLHEDIYDDFLACLVDKIANLKVGDPRDETSDIGAVINKKQYDRIADYIADGKLQPGVEVAYDGRGALTAGEPGFYHAPVIFSQVKNHWRIAQEEIFGPVLSVLQWDELDEVVAMANDTDYGLAAFVFSKDLDQAVNAAHQIESGWVQVNQGGGQVVGQTYGGYKTSGIGREVSLEGMLEGFTQIKQINIQLS